MITQYFVPPILPEVNEKSDLIIMTENLADDVKYVNQFRILRSEIITAYSRLI